VKKETEEVCCCWFDLIWFGFVLKSEEETATQQHQHNCPFLQSQYLLLYILLCVLLIIISTKILGLDRNKDIILV